MFVYFLSFCFQDASNIVSTDMQTTDSQCAYVINSAEAAVDMQMSIEEVLTNVTAAASNIQVRWNWVYLHMVIRWIFTMD